MSNNAGPNILVIQADQMAASALSAYGNSFTKTPHIDALAEEGTIFRNTYCAFPLCGPSRASMMTGQLPSKIRAYDNAAELMSEIPTFAHYLRARGYQTSLSGKMHFVGADQLHGFERRLTSDIYPGDFYWTENMATRTAKTRSDGRAITQSGICMRTVQLDYDELTMANAEQHLYDIARLPDDRPFMSVVSLTHPHDPYYCTRPFWDLYEGVDIPMPAAPALPIDEQDPLTRYIMIRHVLDEGFDDDTIMRSRRAYYGAVSYIDHQVGRLVNLLEELSLRENTVIIFTSDHGEFLGERGLWFKRHFYEPAAAVPLIISVPGGLKGNVVPENVSLMDLLPTMLDLAGDHELVDLREPIDGQSLVPLMNGGSRESVAYSEIMSDGLPSPIFMIRRDNWKLIYGLAYPAELYDLDEDPHEKSNLANAPEATDVLNRLVVEAEAKWDAAAIQADIDLSIARRILVRGAHGAGQSPIWDYVTPSGEEGRWCRSGSDYNDWSFNVI